MAWYAALLRGIAPTNPAMSNANLRAVAAAEGLESVATVISSGNLVFETERDPAEVEAALEAAWPRELGFESMTTLRSREDLEAIVALDPFRGLEHGPRSYLLVTFAKHPLPSTFWDAAEQGIDLVGRTDREVFTVTDTTIREGSATMSLLESGVGKQITSRTWLTVGRILARMG
ncbi:MAG: DUF1697 domain-containing protein [Actinomycetes bacterium]|jgi:uncharacterized protein (DUF1697 family)|nr:MAG: DUF1697 domain-containing protein [Actinomycetota bacterium]